MDKEDIYLKDHNSKQGGAWIVVKRDTVVNSYIFVGGCMFGAGILSLAIAYQLGNTKIGISGLLYIVTGVLLALYGLKRI